MPVTRGHGNPKWSREETILALDLLYRHGRPVDRNHDDVIELSGLLNQANFHSMEVRNDTFRNPAGVALKLQNLRSAADAGTGLSFSKMDLAVTNEFPQSKQTEVHRAADVIRAAIES